MLASLAILTFKDQMIWDAVLVTVYWVILSLSLMESVIQSPLSVPVSPTLLACVVKYVKMVSILMHHLLDPVLCAVAMRKDHSIQPVVMMGSVTVIKQVVGLVVCVEWVSMAFLSKNIVWCLSSISLLLSLSSCQNCQCNSSGSLDSVCNVTTGECHCKSFVTGMNCDTCLTGYQLLQSGNPFGCSKGKEKLKQRAK